MIQTITQREGLLLHWGSSWSEIAPLPGFSRETLAEAEQEAIAFLTAFKQGKTIPVSCPSVQFGLDCARRSWPILKHTRYRRICCCKAHPMTSSGAGKSGCMTTRSRSELKVARYPMRDELSMVRELIRLAPKTKLILDANQQWTREEAWTFMNHLDPSHRVCRRSLPFLCGYPFRRRTYRHRWHWMRSSAVSQWDFFPQLKGLILETDADWFSGKMSRSGSKSRKANGVKLIS